MDEQMANWMDRLMVERLGRKGLIPRIYNLPNSRTGPQRALEPLEMRKKKIDNGRGWNPVLRKPDLIQTFFSSFFFPSSHGTFRSINMWLGFPWYLLLQSLLGWLFKYLQSAEMLLIFPKPLTSLPPLWRGKLGKSPSASSSINHSAFCQGQACRPQATTGPSSQTHPRQPRKVSRSRSGIQWLEAGGWMRWLFVVPTRGFRDCHPQSWPSAQISRPMSSGEAHKDYTQSLLPASLLEGG